MDTLLKKLDRLSSPLGSLLDAALDRLAPHTTASACGGTYLCKTLCSGGFCHGGPGIHLYWKYWASTIDNCVSGHYSAVCDLGCIC